MTNLADFLIVDAHQDLAYGALTLGRDHGRSALETRAQEHGSALNAGSCMVGLPELLAGRVAVIFGTVFTMPAHRAMFNWDTVYKDAQTAHSQGMAQLDVYHRWADDEQQIALVRSQAELRTVLASWQAGAPDARQVGIVPLMENADPIREPAELEMWFERGIRIVGPAWTRSRYSGGTGDPGPLTDLGRELLELMAELGVGLDLSHMAERAALEAVDRFEGVLLASHSNPRGLVPGDRHLSDTLIRGIAEREGVMGIVLYNGFLRRRWRMGDRKEQVTLDDVVQAIDYVCQRVGSAQHVALGSDFDGGFGSESVPAGLDTVADLPNIAVALKARGFEPGHITDIMGGNWLRLLRRLLPE
ncbi:MAG: peptidase M19 [Delftia sp.]|nr:peptidase M19 [Delftia sp.]